MSITNQFNGKVQFIPIVEEEAELWPSEVEIRRDM